MSLCSGKLTFFIALGLLVRKCQLQVLITNPSGPITIFVNDGLPVGYEIFDVDSQVPSASPIEYVFPSSSSAFSINVSTGWISITTPLNFELQKQYRFDVVARQISNILDFDEVSFIVNIQPANEHAPKFASSILNVNITENAPLDTLVSYLTCNDSDTGTNPGCTNISIISGDDTSAKFKIVGDQMLTTSNAIDYDVMTMANFLYTLVVIATDSPSVGRVRTGTMTVIVTVDPENEFEPAVSGIPLSTTIPENSPVGTDVLTVTATDGDTGTHGELTYRITGGNPGDVFIISEKIGKIFTKRILNFEDTPSYDLAVQVMDGGLRSSTTSVRIAITDVNDNPPECSPFHYTLSVNETLAIGRTIVTPACTDKDVGTTLGYSILSGDLGDIEITSRGEVKVKRDLAYDDGTFAYLLTIEVTDAVHTVSVTVVVNLLPVNEFPPLFNPLSVTIDEDMQPGTEIATFTATDGDAYPDNVVSYAISEVQNGPVDAFLVDSDTGKVYLSRPLDYETVTRYLVAVTASDSGTSKGTGTVTVSIRNTNDNAPYCPKAVFSVSVSEKAEPNAVVIQDFGCTDHDHDVISYSLSQSPDDNTFDVSSGGLIVRGNLDYETVSFYSIDVLALDSRFNRSVKVAVNLINENEEPPRFPNSVIPSMLNEAAPPGTVVLTVTARDPDGDPFTYNFRTTYPNFILDSQSGKIVLSKSLDREKWSSYELHVVASDGSLYSTATVQLTIGDTNEPPRFNNRNYVFSIDENTASGQSVGTVSAIDVDSSGTNGLIHHIIISGNDLSYFQINSSTGEITVVSPPDYEEAESVLLTLQATDQGVPSTSAFCTVTIYIVDLNDNAPAFTSSVIQKWIAENTVLGNSVTQIFATDYDSPINGNNKFTFNSVSNVPFQIGSASGVVTVTHPLDRETVDRHIMVITATDKGSPPLTGTLTLEIHLTDVNDNDPHIVGMYDTTVPENSLLNTIIFTLTANDDDANAFEKFNYTLLSGNIDSSFKLDNITGVLQVASNLDRERTEKFELVIQVADNSSPSRSSSVTTSITIDDVNDSTPVFKKSTYAFSVDEHVISSTTVGSVEATDNDKGLNAALVYSIATNWKGATDMFGINKTSGKIFTQGDLDRELEAHYLLWVRVQDGGSPPLSAEVTVNVTINDINDQTPLFGQQEYSASVLESLARGSMILSAWAVDNDEGLNGEVKYELDMTTQEGLLADYFFGIRSTSGEIILKKSLDRETYQTFTFTMIGRDSGEPPKSSNVNVTIHVLDANDNRPQFSPEFYDSEASLTEYCDASIAFVTAVDGDTGINAQVRYIMVSTASPVPFVVDGAGIVKSNGEPTESKYVIEIESVDQGSPALTSVNNGIVRIDTFGPEEVVITFYLDLNLVSYLSVENAFVSQVQIVLKATFPDSYVKRWCLEDKVQSVLVHVYGIKNDVTKTIGNMARDKTFITNGEFINVLQLSPSQIPTVVINDMTWDSYKIEKVVPFGDKLVFPPATTAPQTDDDDGMAIGLGVFFALFIAGLAVIIIAFLFWKKRWCKREKKADNTKNPRVQIIEIRGVNGNSLEENGITSGNNPDTKAPHSSISVVTPLKAVDSQGRALDKMDSNGPYINIPSTESPGISVSSSRQDLKSITLSPSLIGNTMSNVSTPLPTKPSLPYPKRGVDFVTGWVYEEDPDSKVRKWVRTPDGDPIFDKISNE